MAKKKTELELAQESLRKALEARYAMTDRFKREGTQIVVPEFMDLDDAGHALLQYHKEQEEEIQVDHLFKDVHPNEALFCFYNAVGELFGRMVAQTTSVFFGMFKIPGRSHPVAVDYGETQNFPVGKVQIPGVPIEMQVGINDVDDMKDLKGTAMQVRFTCQRKYEPLVQDIIKNAERHLREGSLFRGKAFDSSWKFINVRGFDPDTVSYSHVERRLLSANLFTPITKSANARKLNIPLKRGVLLYGPYGTGKTLTALHTGKVCVENGWTFIQVRDTDNVANFLRQAQRLQPAVVFFEDVDAVAGGERNAALNSILNMVDGILSKDSEVIVVLTTNHLEKISRAMLRPGRLDAVVSLGAFEAERTVDMVRKAFANSKDKSVVLTDKEPDLEAIAQAAEGYPPAFIAEAVNKSRLYGLEQASEQGDTVTVEWDDFVMALKELRTQFQMMNEAQVIDPIPLNAALKELVDESVVEHIPEIADGVYQRLSN